MTEKLGVTEKTRTELSQTQTDRASAAYTLTIATIWLPQESHTGMSLPSTVLRVDAFGYVKRV